MLVFMSWSSEESFPSLLVVSLLLYGSIFALIWPKETIAPKSLSAPTQIKESLWEHEKENVGMIKIKSWAELDTSSSL